MANITSTSQIDSAVGVYYDRQLLERAKKALVHTQFAQQRNLPSKNSDTIKFRRYSNLATATTALSEGITPTGHALSKTDMTAQVEQYGTYITLTDVVQYTVEDNVMNEASNILAQQMSETVDELVRDVMASTLSSTNCTAGVNGGTPTELTYSDIQGAVITLLGQDAKRFTPIVNASNKFGTAPVGKSYWALGDVDLLDDLQAMKQWVNIEGYGGASFIENEFGKVGNTRWVLTSGGYVSSGTYSNFIVGENSYAVTMLKEGISKHIFTPSNDPLRQRSELGWKHYMASRILNDNWILKLNCTHS